MVKQWNNDGGTEMTEEWNRDGGTVEREMTEAGNNNGGTVEELWCNSGRETVRSGILAKYHVQIMLSFV